MRGERNPHPPLHPPVFLPKITRIFGSLLLVDGQALREPETHFYWSTGGEKPATCLYLSTDEIIEGYQRILYPVSRAYTYQIFSFSYSLLGNEPISGSHFSGFLHILPLKQYKGWISIKSMKMKIILY